MLDENSKDSVFGKYSLSMLSIAILIVFLGMVFFLYFWVSKQNKGELVFPAGINYTGELEIQPQPPQKPTYDWTALSTSTSLATFVSPKRQYTFQYPNGIYPLIFPGWEADGVTFDVTKTDPRFNVMLLVENIGNYDPALSGNLEGFIKAYNRFFPGLKGLKTIESVTTAKGLTGFKANFETKGGEITNDNYFLAIPNDKQRVLHVTNIFPAEGNAVFLRILDTLSLDVPNPTLSR